MDQDWTLTVHPERIPMELRYPGKYTVNSLPVVSRSKRNQNPWGPWGKPNKAPCGTAKRGNNNPNLIPLSQGRKKGKPSTREGIGSTIQDTRNKETGDASKTNHHATLEW